MDRFIQDIVDVDRQCVKMIEDAKRKKNNLQSDLNMRQKEIANALIKQQQDDILAFKKDMEDKINDAIKKEDVLFNESLENLKKSYELNKDHWIEEILANCKKV